MRTPRRSPPHPAVRCTDPGPPSGSRVAQSVPARCGRLPFKEAHIVPTQAVQDTDLPGKRDRWAGRENGSAAGRRARRQTPERLCRRGITNTGSSLPHAGPSGAILAKYGKRRLWPWAYTPYRSTGSFYVAPDGLHKISVQQHRLLDDPCHPRIVREPWTTYGAGTGMHTRSPILSVQEHTGESVSRGSAVGPTSWHRSK